MAGKAPTALDQKGWLYNPGFPDHWKRCPLYSMAEWVNGLAFRTIQCSDAGMPVIKIAEINAETQKTLTTISANTSKYQAKSPR